jgi:hypothetical protein
MRSRSVRSPRLAGNQRRCPLMLRGSFLVLPRTGSPGHERPVAPPGSEISNVAKSCRSPCREGWQEPT